MSTLHSLHKHRARPSVWFGLSWAELSWDRARLYWIRLDWIGRADQRREYVASHQPIDSTTPSGLIILYYGEPGRAIPQASANSRAPSSRPSQALDEGNGPPTPLPLPFVRYVHPPAVAPPMLPTRRQQHSLIGPPDCHSCILSGCIRCPLQGNWSPRMPYGAVSILLSGSLGACPFPGPLRPHVCMCVCALRSAAPFPKLSPTQLSSGQPAYRFVAVLRDESTTELRRTSTRKPPGLP